MIFNKIAVYACMGDALRNAPFRSWLPTYSDKLVVGEYTTSCGTTVVRSWKNRSHFGIDSSPDFHKRAVGGLDYTVSDAAKALKIEYLYVRDREPSGKANPDPEFAENAVEATAFMVALAEKAARERGFGRITMDVHKNKKLYELYYAAEGFRLTGRVASDPSAWLETEKALAAPSAIAALAKDGSECDDGCAL